MKFSRKILSVLALIGLATPLSSHAASGWFTAGGQPLAWGGPTLSYHPEAGSCGPLSNSQVLSEVQTYVALWDASDFVSLTLSMVTGTVPSVTSSNYSTYAEGDAQNDSTHPVIFDDDGEIIDSTSGEGQHNSILGFAGPSTYNTSTGEIADGEMVMNCRCFEGNPLGTCDNGFTFNELSFFSTLTHEFGHLLGLDHSQVNAAHVATETADDNDDVPLMYPTDFTMAEVNLSTDDLASIAAVYPSSSYTSSRCRVTGTVLDSSGDPLRCADVQAVPTNVANTISFISGAAAVAADGNNDGDSVDSGECTSGCGDFTLYLTPNTDYTIRIEPIDASFTGGSSVGPCSNEQKTTITSQQLSTVSGSSCTAGGTLALGNLTSSSTGGDSGSSSGGSSSSSSGGGSSGCTLNADSTKTGIWMPLMLMSLGLLTLIKARRKIV